MELKEASMNFDLESLPLFLTRIPPLIESGFSGQEVQSIQKTAEKLDHDEEDILDFSVQYKGEQVPLKVVIFMDDIEAPNVYFYTHPALADEIAQEMRDFAEEQAW